MTVRHAKGHPPLGRAYTLLLSCTGLGCAQGGAHDVYLLDPTFHAQVIAERLVAFDAEGAMILRSTQRDGRESWARAPLPAGPRTPVSPQTAPLTPETLSSSGGRTVPKTTRGRSTTWTQPTMHSSDGLLLRLETTPPLAGRTEAQLSAELEGGRTLIERIPVVEHLVVGDLVVAPNPRFAILTLTSGDLESIHVIDLDRAAAQALDDLAIQSLALGARTAALALLERAVAIDSTDSTAVYNLACVFALEGRLDDATATLERALALDRLRLLRLARHDPDLAPLRDDPERARRLGLERVPRKTDAGSR